MAINVHNATLGSQVNELDNQNDDQEALFSLNVIKDKSELQKINKDLAENRDGLAPIDEDDINDDNIFRKALENVDASESDSDYDNDPVDSGEDEPEDEEQAYYAQLDRNLDSM